jgi:hypothetical protein
LGTKKSEYPAGWDDASIRDLLDHYERQTEEEAAAEHEAALSRPDHTLMEVPTELVPAVREIIAEHERQHKTH